MDGKQSLLSESFLSLCRIARGAVGAVLEDCQEEVASMAALEDGVGQWVHLCLCWLAWGVYATVQLRVQGKSLLGKIFNFSRLQLLYPLSSGHNDV